MRALLFAWIVLLCGTAAADVVITNGIVDVTPTSAPAGTNGMTVTFTLQSQGLPPFPGPTPIDARLGTNSGSSISRPSSNIVTAVFSILESEPAGPRTVDVIFPAPPPDNAVIFNLEDGFEILPPDGASSAGPVDITNQNAIVSNNITTATVAGTNAPQIVGTMTWTNKLNGSQDVFSASSAWTISGIALDVGENRICVTGTNTAGESFSDDVTIGRFPGGEVKPYTVVDTGQTTFYDNTGSAISAPGSNSVYYGQDAQYTRNPPKFIDLMNGVIVDANTGLMWQRDPVLTKLSWTNALHGATNVTTGGYTDWRLPSIKELYSLMDFSGFTGTDADGSQPFIDTNYFGFSYGNTDAGERFIDAQYWTSTEYVHETQLNSAGPSETVFGVNFADGRIKGYPKSVQMGPTTRINSNYVRYVRGNTTYGINGFVDHGDGTVSDTNTCLMWTQDDSAGTHNWTGALAYVQALNTTNHLGYSDWRLPHAKELQGLVDYTKSPMTTGSAAIDTNFFNVTTNESWHWTGTSHVEGGGGSPSGDWAVYICFGRAIGTNDWDVHGAGAQRSDPKSGNPDSPMYVNGFGPQGDEIRIFNYVRPVRDVTDSGPVIYVDADTAAGAGQQDGRSWATAFADLTDALAVATTQQIWVADGIYYPDQAAAGVAIVTNDNTGSTFQVPSGVQLLGGFAGTETNVAQRVITNATDSILCGDLDGNDYGKMAMGNNALRVVTLATGSADIVIDGFLIRRGSATEGFSPGAANDGGGLYGNNASAELRNCTFYANHASDSGGGVYLSGASTFSNCVFECNTADNGGGAEVAFARFEFVDCTFTDNTATNATGEMNQGGGGLNMNNTLGSGTSTLVRCVFTGNIARDDGGGMWISEAQASLPHCTIRGNDTDGSGGGLLLELVRGTVGNTLIAGNEARDGGGIYLTDNTALRLENCTVAGNRAEDAGGAIFNDGTNVTVLNGILWSNVDSVGVPFTTQSITNSAGATAAFSHSIVARAFDGSTWRTIAGVDAGGNTDESPGFIAGPNPIGAPNISGDFHMASDSAAINAGSNGSVTASTDLDRETRILETTVDMGCYESSDADGDMLTKYEEQTLYGTDPNDANSDDDPHDDYEEIIAGTSATNRQDFLQISSVEYIDEGTVLSWPSVSSRSYRIFCTTNIADTNAWTQVASQSASPPLNVFTNTSVSNLPAYYFLSVRFVQN